MVNRGERRLLVMKEIEGYYREVGKRRSGWEGRVMCMYPWK